MMLKVSEYTDRATGETKYAVTAEYGGHIAVCGIKETAQLICDALSDIDYLVDRLHDCGIPYELPSQKAGTSN